MWLALRLRWAGAQTGDFKNTPVVKVIISNVSSHGVLLQSFGFIILKPVIDVEIKKNRAPELFYRPFDRYKSFVFSGLMLWLWQRVSSRAQHLATWVGERSLRRSRLKLRDDVRVTAEQSAAHAPVTDVYGFQLPGKTDLIGLKRSLL